MEYQHVTDAKVASIVSDRSIAINAGTDAGVLADDTVILHRTVAVIDPDTAEPLGEIELPKVYCKITDVQPRFAVAEVTSRTSGAEQASFLDVAMGRVSRKSVTDDPRIGSETGDEVLVYIGEKARVERRVGS